MKRRIWLLLILMLLPTAVFAQSTTLRWERYDNRAEIQRDGSVRVRETYDLSVSEQARNRITRSFQTGSFAQVRDVTVAVDGKTYARGSGTPGTYVANDAGDQAEIRIVYLDPSLSRHTIQISYTLDRVLTTQGDQAAFRWNFFWSGANVPPIQQGSVEVVLPQSIDQAELDVTTDGPQVETQYTARGVRWDLSEPIQGEQLAIEAAFPRALLAANARFRSSGSTTTNNPAQNVPVTTTAPAAAPLIGLGFCLIAMLVLLVVAFVVLRSLTRGRGYMPPAAPYDPYSQYPQPGWGPFGGMGRRRRRRSGGWGGGYGVPPIIIPPGDPFPPSADRRYDNDPWPDNTPDDSGGGGGFSPWGGSSGGGGSWGDSGGGFSSWGSSGGGGGSWGGGDSGGGGGGGDNNSGGSGGGSFG